MRKYSEKMVKRAYNMSIDMSQKMQSEYFSQLTKGKLVKT